MSAKKPGEFAFKLKRESEGGHARFPLDQCWFFFIFGFFVSSVNFLVLACFASAV